MATQTRWSHASFVYIRFLVLIVALPCHM